ncbi:hypothetical protein HYFRA_00008456 [Hymenoscyphus fraxineus]|uniref:Ams2/SPT21 N-terminal domain-containing protein n=1 Tax=Hymenoscyphus fraxineus TaxID=746836 RepID=A0A9N9KP63_9HELO|nr:hypothetical protein HYFRA_00008456 [Hymenoscyphus fraxineus]
MSSPANLPIGGPTSTWSNGGHQSSMLNPNAGSNEDGVTVRPMRLKVLYTFDDENKVNCLARWPHVLQVQTVAMDEVNSIGVIELKTCIEAIVQCSPELVARLGKDYTVYAYDYSEYDTPLVGQGMLSWSLAAATSTSDASSQQSAKLITGRVCKNILGLFSNGVKETLEVKLRLVAVPTVSQSQYVDAMEKYREISKSVPAGLDPKDWMNFIQSNPNIGQSVSGKATPIPCALPTQGQRDGTSMEVVNQLLSPSLQQQPMMSNMDSNANQSSGETAAGKPKRAPRPSRAGVKRPRKPRAPKNAPVQGGNTSGYEEGTDGDDAPSNRKRAKITQTDWNSKSAIGDKSDSLRVAASTAGSLRSFRPIAMNPSAAGSHLQEIPRAPTPVPRGPSQHLSRDSRPPQSGMRHESFSAPSADPRRHVSPYPRLDNPQDQLRTSIEESIQTSPERQDSPVVTPPGIGSSPPVMRTRPPSMMRSSPPCPSSPVLPQLPRTDSGFMSGSMEELFGEGEDEPLHLDECPEISPELPRHRTPPPPPPQPAQVFDSGFVIEEEMPGPMELLPTKMPVRPEPKPPSKRNQARAASRAASRALSRANSIASDDGQVLPPLRREDGFTPSGLSMPVYVPPPQQAQQGPIIQQSQRPLSRPVSRPASRGDPKGPSPAPVALPQNQPTNVQAASVQNPAPQPRPASRQIVRTASLGALTLPELPPSDPVLPPSNLHRSQTWSEAAHTASAPAEASNEPPPLIYYMSQFPDYYPGMDVNSSEYARLSKKASIRQKLEVAIANGESPPFCNNCGAIETPTWRKSWVQERQGQPGYYEYSDAPGKVTCISVLTRDEGGTPTSYQLIYKALLPSDNKDEFKEYQLCNPCGIWLQKYKSQRPREKWQAYQSTARTRNRNQGAYMTSDAAFPPSDAYVPQSEANFAPPFLPQAKQLPQGNNAGHGEAGSPVEDTNCVERQPSEVSQVGVQMQRSNSSQPPKRLKAMTSDAAPAALRRAIQSSPMRWGTRKSPISLDEETQSPNTRRLLFPSPRKLGSPKVLGQLAVTNVVQISSDSHFSDKEIMDAIDKENEPPANATDEEEEDLELLALFEEEMARPSTPKQKSPVANPFKTPTRPTPNHRPITRSISRTHPALSPGQMLTFDQTPAKTPTRSVRRSPRNHEQNMAISPFTMHLNQLMNETNNNNLSPVRNLEADFQRLQDANEKGNGGLNMEDFLSTDVPMPSSPPGAFDFYDDPMMHQIDWDEFHSFNMQQPQEEVQVKVEENESEDGEPSA